MLLASHSTKSNNILLPSSLQGVDLLFLAVVNIVEMRAVLLLCGDGEAALASQAFPDCSLQCPGVLDLGARVSRKKEFVPPLTSACQSFVLAHHVRKSSNRSDDHSSSSSGHSSTKRKASCVEDPPADTKKAAAVGTGDVVDTKSASSENTRASSSTNCDPTSSSKSAKDTEGDVFFISG